MRLPHKGRLQSLAHQIRPKPVRLGLLLLLTDEEIEAWNGLSHAQGIPSASALHHSPPASESSES